MVEVIVGGGSFTGTCLRQKFDKEGKTYVIMPVESLLDIDGMHHFLSTQPYNLYYLASYGNLHGQDFIPEIYQACITKLLNLLLAAKGTPCQGMVTAGSTSEYGNKNEPMAEEMLLEPKTFYAAAKAGATHLAQVWALQNNFPLVIYRPSSITGVGEQSIHLIPTLIRSCLFKEPIPFVGEYKHDYINVMDVCDALAVLTESANLHKGEIFNVGSETQYSNQEVRDMIEEITKSKAKIITYAKLNPQNVSDMWVCDSTKMRSLNWKPKYTLFNTLKEMVKAI
jgi:nucleoside-diphosphate-sugar epimerase